MKASKTFRLMVATLFVLAVTPSIAAGVPASQPELVSRRVTTVTGAEAAAAIIDGLRSVDISEEGAKVTLDIEGRPTTFDVQYAPLLDPDTGGLGSLIVLWFLMSGLSRAARIAFALGRR